MVGILILKQRSLSSRERLLCSNVRVLVAAAAAAHQLQYSHEDIYAVKIDGERKRNRGSSVAAGADAGEVSNREQRKDSECKPAIGIRRQEMEEHARDAGNHQQQESGEADPSDATVIDVEEIGHAAHHCHATAGGAGGIEDQRWPKCPDVPVDQWADLPAHKVGQAKEQPERQCRIPAARKVDGEDQPEDGDKADKASTGRSRGHAEGRDQKAKSCNSKDFRQ